MLFNSIDFAVFLPIVFVLYWFVVNANLKFQNFLLLVASYIFYGWWDWRFLFLIFISSIIDYTLGILLFNEEDKLKRKLYLLSSLTINLGFLGFFKYYNFFLENFTKAFSIFGGSINASSLSIILPLGISFYTFQTLSYTIDIYKKELKPTKDLISFLAYVSFFPQLVAGPIERARNLLPQFEIKRSFSEKKAVNGLKQILWGLFKKIIIADHCAEIANVLFANPENFKGSSLALGSVFFALQIYGDFSGYSDIAIGTSRLFGFNLKQNFAFPYFSRDIAEFWRRWHISLSTWFRDYLYIPLGGSKGGIAMKVRNTFIIFIVSGFWHGANWTFIIWGFLNALYFLPLLLLKRNRNNLSVVAENTNLPSLKELFQILITFSLTCLTWVFFRAGSIGHAISYLSIIFSKSFFTLPDSSIIKEPILFLTGILVFIVLEWQGRRNLFALDKLNLGKYTNWALYIFLATFIIWNSGKPQEFIYFQF